ncbi:MAG: ABC transporter permease subunit, partial [Acidobacteria bacterium]|nr:ABC transporter permease subunit [Candidatus Sulfomarinibacter kjeldsenii]
MRAVWAIAANTFREAVRDRVLYLFIGFAVVMVVSSKLFGMLTVGNETKIIKDIGLAAMQFFSMLIAVMMSMILISREVDSRTVFNILAKPVRRWQFILGKYLGLVLIVAANLVLITFVLMLTVLVAAGELDLMLLFAGAMTMLEMMVLAAFATLFAVLTRP